MGGFQMKLEWHQDTIQFQGTKQNPPLSEIIIIIVIMMCNVARHDGQESHDCTNPGTQNLAGSQSDGHGSWSECFPWHHVSAMDAAVEVRSDELRSTSLFFEHCVV